MQLTVRDETMGGEVKNSFTIRDLAETVSVREVIRSRVYQEVQDHNASGRARNLFKGLLSPAPLESRLNEIKAAPKKVDWERQYGSACEAFERNQFFVLINDQQAESLDQTFKVEVDSYVSFVKLVTLVGG